MGLYQTKKIFKVYFIDYVFPLNLYSIFSGYSRSYQMYNFYTLFRINKSISNQYHTNSFRV